MIARRKAFGKTVYDVSVGNGPKRSFHRYDDAEEYEADQKRSRRRERAGLGNSEKPNITYAALVKLWEANFNPSEWRMAMNAHALKRWGKVRVRAIQPEAVGEWINSLKGAKGQPLSEKTRAHVLETFRQVLNAGVEWDYLTKSPARRSRGFKTPSKKSRVRPIRPFETWDEVLRVAEACGKLGPFVRFVCATGVRCPGEAVYLRWSDIDFGGKSMRVGSKTDAGHRTVPLSRHAIEALNDLPRSLTGFVFIGKTGGAFDYRNWRKNEWREALVTCGLEHRSPYEMRHTFATLALSNGASIDDVATVMGHEDISVAYNYYRKWTRTAADRLRSQLDTIDSADAEESTGT